MSNNNQTKKTPLFTVFRKESTNKKTSYKIRGIAVAIAFVLTLIIASLIVKDWPHMVIWKMVEEAVSSPVVLLYYTALLLGFGVAIVPAFKMKYWNMGANGQVLVASLATILVMFYKRDLPNAVLIPLMFIVAILASVLWSVIPAIFKVFFNTNETLFTLMMNYLAIGLVAYANYVMAMGKKESPGVINSLTEKGWVKLGFLPRNIQNYIIPIILIVLVTVIISIYMKKTKHGYEVTVIGDSINTAKYVGMKTKWITIRTMILGGIVTGIIGFCFSACVQHSLSASQCGGLGFTGILIAWLGNFNPIIMALISLGLAFLTKGTDRVSSFYRLGNNNLSSVIIGVIFFAVLISEFFITYRIKINDNGTKFSQFLCKIFNSKEEEAIQKMIEEKEAAKSNVEEIAEEANDALEKNDQKDNQLENKEIEEVKQC